MEKGENMLFTAAKVKERAVSFLLAYDLMTFSTFTLTVPFSIS